MLVYQRVYKNVIIGIWDTYPDANHGAGIFTYIYPKNDQNVGKCSAYGIYYIMYILYMYTYSYTINEYTVEQQYIGCFCEFVDFVVVPSLYLFSLFFGWGYSRNIQMVSH